MSPMTKFLATAAIAATSALAQYAGDMTYYDPGLGSCGITNSASDWIVALSPAEYGTWPNPNTADVCGKVIQINYNGLTAQATVTDTCPTCASGSIDVSRPVFDSLADEALGRVQVTWNWV